MMCPSDLDLAEIERLLQEATSGAPWLYRPSPMDDWGWVRDSEGRLVAVAKPGRYLTPEEEAEHRANHTDPCEAKARLIAAAPAALRSLIERVRAMEEALRLARGVYQEQFALQSSTSRGAEKIPLYALRAWQALDADATKESDHG